MFILDFFKRIYNRYWFKPTVVKPKTLKKEINYDKDELLSHTMFEVLRRFVVEDMQPMIKKGEDHIYWSEKTKNEILDLYRWWTRYQFKKENIYKKYFELKRCHSRRRYKKSRKHWIIEYSSEEKEREIKEEYMNACKKNAALKEELNGRMHQLINLSNHLWA